MGKIVTFYSYKGGTGRSMALANVAWILASQGQRVLAVDWDLEAPGLHRYFRPFLPDKELTRVESQGVIDFMIDLVEQLITRGSGASSEVQEWFRQRADISKWSQRLLWPSGQDAQTESGGYIDFVPAGRQGPQYARRVNSFDWIGFYERYNGGGFMEAVRESMRLYDWVLIDSRTGVSDTSGICTVQLPDILVACFTLNYQSIAGTAAVAASAMASRTDQDLRILPLATRLDADQERLLKAMLAYARTAFNPVLDASINRVRYWQEMGVPYFSRYAYSEKLAPFEDQVHLSTSALPAMERLTSWISGETVTRLRPLPEDQRVAALDEFERLPEAVGGPSADESAGPSTALDTLLARSPELKSFYDELQATLHKWLASSAASDLMPPRALDRLHGLSTLRTALLEDALFHEYWEKSLAARAAARVRRRWQVVAGTAAAAVGIVAALSSSIGWLRLKPSIDSTQPPARSYTARAVEAVGASRDPVRQAMILATIEPTEALDSATIETARRVAAALPALPAIMLDRAGVVDARFDASGKRMMTVAQNALTISAPDGSGELFQLKPPADTGFKAAALDDSGTKVAFVSHGGPNPLYDRKRNGFTVIGLETVFGERVRQREVPGFSTSGPIGFTDGEPTFLMADGTVERWSADGPSLTVLRLPPGELRREAMSPNGRTVAAMYPRTVDTSVVRAWELPGGRELKAVDSVPPGSIALSANGQQLAVVTLDGGIVRDLRGTGQVSWHTGNQAPVDPRMQLAVSSDANWVPTASSGGGSVAVWRTYVSKSAGRSAQPDTARPPIIFTAHSRPLTYMAFSPDNKFLITSDGGAVKFWAVGESPHSVSDSGWADIVKYLRSNVATCLPTADRVELGMTAPEAQTAFDTCVSATSGKH